VALCIRYVGRVHESRVINNLKLLVISSARVDLRGVVTGVRLGVAVGYDVGADLQDADEVDDQRAVDGPVADPTRGLMSPNDSPGTR
jgi:hypothetical protein